MATWPTLRTVSDVDDAWRGLVPVLDELQELAAAWKAGKPSSKFLAELHESAGPVVMRNRVRDMLAMPATAKPTIEPIVAEQLVTNDPVLAFWENRRGVEVLRARRRGGIASARSDLRDLAEHVSTVLFPELVTYWIPAGEAYVSDTARWQAWLATNPAKKAAPPPKKRPPSWF